jgi:hypothetical protein
MTALGNKCRLERKELSSAAGGGPAIFTMAAGPGAGVLGFSDGPGTAPAGPAAAIHPLRLPVAIHPLRLSAITARYQAMTNQILVQVTESSVSYSVEAAPPPTLRNGKKTSFRVKSVEENELTTKFAAKDRIYDSVLIYSLLKIMQDNGLDYNNTFYELTKFDSDFLRKNLLDQRFWDDKLDLSHVGTINIDEPTDAELGKIWTAYNKEQS